MSDPDFLLISSAIKSEERAFTLLVKKWYKRIYNFSFKYFANHDMAMEATQKTFILVHKNINKLESPQSFKSWLYTIAVNCCREESRKKKGKWFSSFISVFKNDETLSMIDHQTYKENVYDPEKEFQQVEMAKILQRALAKIPEEQRTILIMKEYEGLKFREIALILKVSENTIKSRLYYGINALRKILEEWNIKKEEMYYEI